MRQGNDQTQHRVCWLCNKALTLLDGRAVRINARQLWFCYRCARRFYGSSDDRALAYLKLRSETWKAGLSGSTPHE